MGNTKNRKAPVESTSVAENKALAISDTNSNPEDPFDPFESSLLVIEARISGIRARILIDPGAQLSHISDQFFRKNGITLKEENYTATMANNTHQKMISTVYPISISIGGYSKKMRFASNPLNYDLILGKKWTTEHRAVMKCYSNE